MDLDKIKRIFSMVRLLADNAHGGITGVHGSVNPRAVAAIFRAMDIFGSNFVDAGAGNGVVMACAIANGAGKATGYELPENDAHRFIFAALMSRLEQTMLPPGYSVGRVLWKPQDINEVPLYLLYLLCCFHCLPNVQFPNLFDKTVGALQVAALPVGTESVFSFWVGMDFSTQAHILDLCICCETVKNAAVFQDRKWRNPKEGIQSCKFVALLLSGFSLRDLM